MLGPRNKAGCREDNCIHVCFSKMGLINRCNHYMKQGAEVDGHIVYHLFSNDFTALKLLEKGRKPYLISFTPTFEEAVMAANPHGLLGDEVPSLLGLLINAWAYRQFKPQFSPAKLGDCTAAMFQGGVAAIKLEEFVLLSDDELPNC